MVIPVPVRFIEPVCPCRERIPVLVIVGLASGPARAMPLPAVIPWKRLGAVRIPFISTFFSNCAFSRKKLSTLTAKMKSGFDDTSDKIGALFCWASWSPAGRGRIELRQM